MNLDMLDNYSKEKSSGVGVHFNILPSSNMCFTCKIALSQVLLFLFSLLPTCCRQFGLVQGTQQNLHSLRKLLIHRILHLFPVSFENIFDIVLNFQA
ncbi:hypothetical protein BpHYR1_020131 [Brachionus plicatilis]|uniref:Uncharacterized protein n=1 Tax=Brachionus plicatilis TaxID=10195 RepID=A0A3M7P2Z1_BRAPC|nr:hypothetical protein BpHYR1_020131 [Brachionus plicatilis]